MVLIGTYMVFLDTTIVNVALPQIGIDLHSGSGIEWVVTAYLLALGVSQPATGWLADRLGRKRVFSLTMVLFATASLLAALSPSFPFLIGFRALQGLAGGAMMPVGMAMIYELFPPDRRGMALGVWGVAAMAAPAIGPPLGGFLVTTVGWRSLFLINVPIGYIGIFVALRLLKDTGYREKRSFDTRGMALASTGLILMLLALSEVTSWGWLSVRFLGALGTGMVLETLFVRHALRTPDPLVDVRIFRRPVFALTMAIVWVVTVAQFARLVFVPIELETLRDMTALHVGLIMAPAALGASAAMPVGGWLTDHVGPRPPVVLGLTIMAIGTWLLANLGLTTGEVHIAVALLIVSTGIGFSNTPNMVAALNTVPAALLSQGTAIRSINRQVAGSFGVALLSTVVITQIGAVSAFGVEGSRTSIQHAYNLVFYVALGSIAIALILAMFLPNARRNREFLEERAREHQQLRPQDAAPIPEAAERV